MFVACSTLAAAIATGSDRIRLRTDTTLVLVPVTVTDRDGRAILDLVPGDLTILEQSQPQQILSFAREEVPAAVGIVLDVSGSMRNKLSHSLAALRAVTAALDREDEAFLISFSDRPEILSDFTLEPESVAASLYGVKAGGHTALIDAVYMGLQKVRTSARKRRALVVISDGADNHSRYSRPELLSLVAEADVQIYSVSIVENALSNEERQGSYLLDRISRTSGGLHFTIRYRRDLPEAAAKLALALKNVYVIGYRPPAGTIPGKWRKIRVVPSSTLGGVRVSAKSGYFVPE